MLLGLRRLFRLGRASTLRSACSKRRTARSKRRGARSDAAEALRGKAYGTGQFGVQFFVHTRARLFLDFSAIFQKLREKRKEP